MSLKRIGNPASVTNKQSRHMAWLSLGVAILSLFIDGFTNYQFDSAVTIAFLTQAVALITLTQARNMNEDIQERKRVERV